MSYRAERQNLTLVSAPYAACSNQLVLILIVTFTYSLHSCMLMLLFMAETSQYSIVVDVHDVNTFFLSMYGAGIHKRGSNIIYYESEA